MSTDQKVALADQATTEYDLCTILAAVELPRSMQYCLQDLVVVRQRFPKYGL